MQNFFWRNSSWILTYSQIHHSELLLGQNHYQFDRASNIFCRYGTLSIFRLSETTIFTSWDPLLVDSRHKRKFCGDPGICLYKMYGLLDCSSLIVICLLSYCFTEKVPHFRMVQRFPECLM